MAIYPYRCTKCGEEEEVVQSISSYRHCPNIPLHCGFSMERKLTPPMMAVDLQNPYVSPIDGTVITSRSEQRAHMQKHGVVFTDDIAPDVERNRKAMQQKAIKDLKEDLITATHMVEAGHRPPVVPEAQLIPGA